MKNSLFIFFVILTSFFVRSQVSSYTFGTSTGTYTPIVGGVNNNNFTSWSNASYTGTLPNTTAGFLDDNVSASLLPIGFNFIYNGTTYTNFGICTNGWISLGALPTNSYSPLSTGTSNNVISAMGADLIGRGSFLANRSSGSAVITITGGDISLISVGDKVIGTGIPVGATVLSKTATTVTISANATSNGTSFHFRFSSSNFGIRYETIGTTPNRTLVVQWTGWQRYTTTGVFGELYNFQIRLNETTNTINVVYNIQGPTSATATTFQIGLRGSLNADFNNRLTTTNWSSTTTGTLNSSTVTLSNTVKPTSGLTYTWTPPVVPVCSGTPNPGNTLSSSATVTAPSGTVNLSLQNATTGTGVTYQWQLSTTSSTTGFSNISGSTLSTYTPTVTTNTWFRCLVTCSGNVGTSTATQITLSYCTPTATTDDNTGLTFVGFNTISNTTSSTSAYSDFTSQSTSLDQGGLYSLTTRVNTDGAFTANVKAWIDWNTNLIFDVSEEYDLGSANNTADGATTLSPLVVAIGSSQAAGNYRMRIRATYNVLPTACGNQNYSETEDYTIVVVVSPPCTGTPVPGNTVSSSLTTAPNGTVNLSLQNATTGIGVTYVWESSPDNLTWTIFGSSSATQTSPSITSPTWFRATVTCSGNSGISTPIQITLSYCTYNITNNDPTGITSVTFGTISNTSIGGPSYSDFTTQSTTVEQGGIYQLNVNVNTDGNWTVNTKVWIDWNQNYEFEVGEEYSLGSALNTTNGITSLSPLNITVPSGATLGDTRMRIVSVEASDPAPLACGTQLYGEAEDYKLTITPPTGLPVELLYFEGFGYQHYNSLKWSTASEHNSDYFLLERSVDGEQWDYVGATKATGNSTQVVDYLYVDNFRFNGFVYYKLNQFDFDGMFKTYGPISINNTHTNKKVVKYINILGQEVSSETNGFIFEVYEDGTMRKIIR